MVGRIRGSIALSSLTVVVACAGASTSASQPGEPVVAPPATLGDGVYTAEQAGRGNTAYVERCSSCHAEDLRGNSNAPSLVGSSFLFLWEDRTLEELFATIRTQMPTNAPGSLSVQTYLDVLAYVLSANGFPEGMRELDGEPDALRQIVITGR
jgi:mono/diheme cytochrome c family protein